MTWLECSGSGSVEAFAGNDIESSAGDEGGETLLAIFWLFSSRVSRDVEGASSPITKSRSLWSSLLSRITSRSEYCAAP